MPPIQPQVASPTAKDVLLREVDVEFAVRVRRVANVAIADSGVESILLGNKRGDRLRQRVRILRQPAINQDNAIGARTGDDVSAGTDQQVQVVAQLRIRDFRDLGLCEGVRRGQTNCGGGFQESPAR
jgi:hypothetical protein